MEVEDSAPALAGTKRRADGGGADDGARKDRRADGSDAAGGASGDAPRASTVITSGGDAANAFNVQYLSTYYKRLFPFKLMFRWLSYGNDPDSAATTAGVVRDFFNRREICFTMADDVFIRYQCFRDAAEFAAGVRSRMPYKIDIGPVMNVKPSMHHVVKSFECLERELVFDIDMDAYDDIRRCCKGAKVCAKCWAFVNVAVRVLDTVLRDDFGFKHVLFVYSGRRGMHAWVCDPEARALENGQRAALVEYIAALTGNGAVAEEGGAGAKGAPSVARTASGLTVPMHPALVRAFAELEPIFESRIITAEGQGLLATPDAWVRVLDAIPTLPEGDNVPALRATIAAAWERPTATPQERWAALRSTILSAIELSGGSTTGHSTGIYGGVGAGIAAAGRVSTAAARFKLPLATRIALEKFIPAVVLTYTYPRLDVEVSKTVNHLLKAPFCVHPKTGRVCVPINAATVEDFDPTKVPTVADLSRDVLTYLAKVKAAGGAAGAAAAGADDDADDGGAAGGGSGGGRGSEGDMWKHTCLRPYLEFFDDFVRGCEVTALRARRAAADKASAVLGDF